MVQTKARFSPLVRPDLVVVGQSGSPISQGFYWWYDQLQWTGELGEPLVVVYRGGTTICTHFYVGPTMVWDLCQLVRPWWSEPTTWYGHSRMDLKAGMTTVAFSDWSDHIMRPLPAGPTMVK